MILRTTVVLVLFIVLMGIVFGHNAFDTLLFAVALGVGLTPEFLPMISSVTLTQGALRMAREQVIVKRLPAIQNFGSIDILCSDKTGTLTSGVMQFDRAVDAAGSGVAAAADPRLRQQQVRDRHPESARCRPPAAGRADTADTRRWTRSRSISSGVVSRSWSKPPVRRPPAAHHQGRPEPIIERSTAIEVGRTASRRSTPRPQATAAVHERMSEDGLRVLAVAYRWLDTSRRLLERR